ncbi:MAG: hypothetical protein HYV63_18985 [Candidatus Schekmanbacteria bacterium]|nr:hypothetical protein [Candidatus Schekmanbacteria bacterium]
MGAFFGPAARADNETHVYGIAEYDDSGQCVAGEHSVHTDTANAFLDVFEDLKSDGDWDSTVTRNNSNGHGSYWTDSGKASSCVCESYQSSCSCIGVDTSSNLGADEADVIYIHTHGGSNYSSSSPSYSSLILGNKNTDCKPRTDQNMLWGNSPGDLDIAVIKACQGSQYEVFKNGGYWSMTNSSSTFRMWNGFHGNSSCGSHVTSYVEDYAEDSVYNGVGENWLDEAYDWWGDDDCPTSIVFCSTKSNCESMYEYGGWLDRKDTGTKSTSYMWYIEGCDPEAGQELPS